MVSDEVQEHKSLQTSGIITISNYNVMFSVVALSTMYFSVQEENHSHILGIVMIMRISMIHSTCFLNKLHVPYGCDKKKLSDPTMIHSHTKHNHDFGNVAFVMSAIMRTRS